MKKIFTYAIAIACGAALVSCQPELIQGPDAPAVTSATDLGNGMSFTQYSDAEFTTPSATGNYIKFESKAGIVQLYHYKANGDEEVLATGAAGSFVLKPKRGGDPNQKIYGRLANFDGSLTEWEGSLTVDIPADLEPQLKILLGDSGKKTWKWDYNATTGSTCWGNGGAATGSAFTARNVDGHWWGVTAPDSLVTQLQHAGGNATGAESSGAYMVMDEDGNIASYKADGTEIYKSTFTLDDYDPTRASGWQIATLNTKEPAVLFPFSINEGGKSVTSFDVMYLDQNHMTLVYTKGNAAGSWGEITHWMFKNADGAEDALVGSGSRKWGWATDGTECWGNAGNTGGGAAFTWNVVDGKWWGVTSAEQLMDQLAHTGGSDPTGAEDPDAYMIFDNYGKVVSYKSDGSEIYNGSYELTMYDTGRNAGWELGKLKTSSVLFPFSINEGGKVVEEFDVMYLDGDNMTLVYTKGNGSGSWAEITFWRFEAKE